ncbi:hypothetical protein LZ30DRAFT_440894 [Colletotrichum cereale]|nr:hypothetical protein LZ30DRAFT_440894 [Colletotrichum cereale]
MGMRACKRVSVCAARVGARPRCEAVPRKRRSRTQRLGIFSACACVRTVNRRPARRAICIKRARGRGLHAFFPLSSHELRGAYPSPISNCWTTTDHDTTQHVRGGAGVCGVGAEGRPGLSHARRRGVRGPPSSYRARDDRGEAREAKHLGPPRTRQKDGGLFQLKWLGALPRSRAAAVGYPQPLWRFLHCTRFPGTA